MSSSAPPPRSRRLKRGQTVQACRQPTAAQPKLETKLPDATQPCFLVPWSVWNNETRKRSKASGTMLFGRRIATPHSQLRRPSTTSRLPQILHTKDPYPQCACEQKQVLDPRIWKDLPHDIIFSIIKQLNISDQIKWSCVSREFFRFASAKIWSRLSICAEDIEAHWERGHHLEALNRRKSIIQFLARAAYRKNPRFLFGRLDGLRSLDDPLHIYQPQAPEKFANLAELVAPLPGFYVKTLKVEQYRGLEARRSNRRLLGPVHDHVLGVLLRCLPKLTECVLEGRVHALSFKHVLEIQSLTRLEIRSSLGEEIYDRFTNNSWRCLFLDMSLLSTLENLMHLKIGSLLIQEAEGLAMSVSSLRLKSLYVSCSRTAYDEATHQWIYNPKTNPSPLIEFLSSILQPCAEGEQSKISGFPETLKTLWLRDDWHHQIPNLHQIIFRAIKPCQDLHRLSIVNRIDFERYKAMRGFPLYSAMRALNFGSWERLDSEAEIRWHLHYLTPAGNMQWTEVLPDPETKIIGNLSKTLDSLSPDERSNAPIRKALLFQKSSYLPLQVVCVIPQACPHNILYNRCYKCGKGYEYDCREIEDLTHQLRKWETNRRDDDREHRLQRFAKTVEKIGRRA